MKKLIIWDFDGVIADTEKLWVENRLYFLRRDYNIDWDFNQAYRHIGGISEHDKRRNLKNLGYEIKENFWSDANKKDYESLKSVALTPYIEDVFNLKEFDHCIATGGIMERTLKKTEQTKVDKFFKKDHIFTVDMVAHGKPEPDLFLFAATTMGYSPKNAIVIEDSPVGIMAAKKAGIKVVAFIKYNTSEIRKSVENLYPDFLTDDMREVKKFLLDFVKK